MADLERSIRALAQPPEVQATLFPDFVCLPDELALDFEESLDLESGALRLLPVACQDAIGRLDKHLTDMSGPQHLDLWETEALSRAPEWSTVRALARDVVALMGWSSEPPPPSRHIYASKPHGEWPPDAS